MLYALITNALCIQRSVEQQVISYHSMMHANVLSHVRVRVMLGSMNHGRSSSDHASFETMQASSPWLNVLVLAIHLWHNKTVATAVQPSLVLLLQFSFASMILTSTIVIIAVSTWLSTHELKGTVRANNL